MKHEKGKHIDLEIPTFLNGKDFKNKVAFTSYSRSGNTFLRKYLEEITGVCTGSDGDIS